MNVVLNATYTHNNIVLKHYLISRNWILKLAVQNGILANQVLNMGRLQWTIVLMLKTFGRTRIPPYWCLFWFVTLCQCTQQSTNTKPQYKIHYPMVVSHCECDLKLDRPTLLNWTEHYYLGLHYWTDNSNTQYTAKYSTVKST